MSSAKLDIHPDEELATPLPPFELTGVEMAGSGLSQPALKQQVAERIAAHRARRGQVATTPAPQTESPRPARGRSAHIAAAVAERYAHSQSYRAFLAAEAERAVHQADAAARVATINAHAIAVAQQQLLADLDNWDLPNNMPAGPVAVPHVPLTAQDYATLFDREPGLPPAAPRAPVFTPDPSAHPVQAAVAQAQSFTVRPYEDAVHPVTAHQQQPLHARSYASDPGLEFDEEERLALDEEIAFRHHPNFEENSLPEPIAPNLIEFPRQLIAARKARPRLAEGPLREGDTPARAPQLRIFEVEADQLSCDTALESVAPEWSSILLSALPTSDFTEAEYPSYLPGIVPQAAPMSLRLMAAIVDVCLILTVQVAFTAVFAFALTHLPGQHSVLEIPRSIAIGGATCTLAVLAMLYQLLFFTFSDSTPGMRYARIGLCTFSDDNPTRSAMRRRILSTLLAIFPLGFGILWAFLDEDTLGWHDRISRMYQRAY